MSTAYAKPLPRITPLTKGFWDNARADRLSVQCCQACGDRHFPAGPMCPRCLSSEQTWETVSGRGELLSWVRFHRAYWEGFSGDLPYTVCLVKLDEGPILLSNLVAEEERTFDVGDTVEVVFEKVTAEVTLPKFRIAR